MAENEKRLHRCCFTGHRPEKLYLTEKKIVKMLEEQIEKAIEDGYVTFITGMARGIDIYAGEIVLKLRKKNKNLHLICALPFDGFETRWSPDWQKRYNKILKKADIVKCISQNYHPRCFQDRNEWMVDRSSLIIAAYNGEPGGTRNTINYAKEQQVEIRVIDC